MEYIKAGKRSENGGSEYRIKRMAKWAITEGAFQTWGVR